MKAAGTVCLAAPAAAVGVVAPAEDPALQVANAAILLAEPGLG